MKGITHSFQEKKVFENRSKIREDMAEKVVFFHGQLNFFDFNRIYLRNYDTDKTVYGLK